MSSVLSFPDRGPWGDSRYRGNCSGHVYKQIFEQLQPKTFCDPMMGSGTSIDVAREMGIQAYGLDLRLGFNALRDSILRAIGGTECDLVLSHPPYFDMVLYSGPGGMWGNERHPDDLSHCVDEEDFHSKLQCVMLNQREATKAGGFYGTIIGDQRKRGRYISYQAECIARMPSDELAAVLIKQQFNCVSDGRRYARMRLPRIDHEFILLFQKREKRVFELLRGIAVQANDRLRNTWRAIVHMVMVQLGGVAPLAQIYQAVEQSAPERVKSNPHWKEKIRQILNQSPDWFCSEQRGVWSLARPGSFPTRAEAA